MADRGPWCMAGHRIVPGAPRVSVGEQWWCLPHYAQVGQPEHTHVRGYWDSTCGLCSKEVAGIYRGVVGPFG
jgi:hypothetical protein